jgi:hypothetical protein
MKDYVPLIIIVSIASIGMICIIVDMIIGSFSEDGGIIIRSSPIKTEEYQEHEAIKDTTFDYDDDLVINE